jgi:hypothetical protein
MNWVAPTVSAANEILDQFDQSFMYTQIIKEILFTIAFDQQHIKDFISYHSQKFVTNTNCKALTNSNMNLTLTTTFFIRHSGIHMLNRIIRNQLFYIVVKVFANKR